jgi:hypothetical protein
LLACASLAGGVASLAGCADGDNYRSGDARGGAPFVSGGGGGGQGGSGTTACVSLQVAPLVFTPTATGFGVNAVVASGDPAGIEIRYRKDSETELGDPVAPEVRAPDVAEWHIEGLEAGTSYRYQVLCSGRSEPLFEGTALTQRAPGEGFRFALLSDTHIGAHLDFNNQGVPDTMRMVSAAINAVSPDFVLNLGDMLDYHQYGFNDPPPDGATARLAYLNYRTLLGVTQGRSAHFPVLGNWDGENGNFSAEEIGRSREQRMLYVPAPTPTSYPEGGSPAQDYYAFTWGDALFVVLNVMSYTKVAHLLSAESGAADDWTLGQTQFDWLASTLVNATSKWRFLFIHHTVGGAAGNEIDSIYGRGGGRAAHVGEQALIHQLMLDTGVQVFFYGHDHVFVDMMVDGIHYTAPGRAGAPWTFGEAETGYTQFWPDSGWAQVDVSAEAVRVRFWALGNQILSEYSIE